MSRATKLWRKIRCSVILKFLFNVIPLFIFSKLYKGIVKYMTNPNKITFILLF